MSENIDGKALFSSGGHRWSWGKREHRSKEFGTVAIAGAGAMLLNNGPRSGFVAGILKGSGASRAAADDALTALEKAIEALCDAGGDYAWEDDHGLRGDHLKLLEYQTGELRDYGTVGTTWWAWQSYQLTVRELMGRLQ